MALQTHYSAGTVSVTNGGTTVTGVGTAWAGKVFAGDLFCDPAQGIISRVTADATDTSRTINAWPGAALSADPYEVLFTADSVRGSERARELLEQLSVVAANGRGLFFKFSDTVTDSDPGPGYLRLNNADPAAATAINIDNLDASGATVSGEIDTWDDGGSTIKGRLWLRSIVTGSAFRSYNVTGSVVDGTGYRKLTLTHVGGSGTFTAEDGLMAFFVPKGDAGDTGAIGVSGGITLTFDDPTADADPGAGKFRLNNATHASATAAYIDNAEALASADISGLLDSWDDSTATIKGTLTIASKANPAIFRTYNVTGSVVDGTGYRKVTIAYVTGAGTLADETSCTLVFSRTGNNGIDGINGVDGTGLFSRVRVVSTANITIATALNNGDTIDGVTLATNDLVLVAGQTAPAENGIYVVGASPARDSSFDTYDEHPGVYISVMEGTANADTLWRCTSNKGGTLNTTGIVFSQFSSGASSSAPNLLDNACFGIAQRGTLFTSTSTPANSDGALLFDRWVLLSDGNDIVDVGREATTVPTSGSTAVYLEVETANKKFGLVQLLTAQRSGPLIGGKASFSFKARKGGSNATVDKLRAAIITWSGTKDAPTKDVVSGTSWGAEGTNPTLATSWTYESTPIDLVLTTSYQEFKIENVDIDTASGKQVAVFIWCDNSDATVNDLVFISEAQLVKGASVPVFSPLTEAEDYSRCQAHLLRATFSASGQRWIVGLISNPTAPVNAAFGFSHAVPFWRAPDVSQSQTTFITATAQYTVTSVTLGYTSGNVTGFFASASGTDTNSAPAQFRSNATGAFIEFDAGIGI